MDVGLNAGAVRANFGNLFDAFLFGIAQDVAGDHLPYLIADGFDITVQSGFFKPFFGHANAAKPTQALRVDGVKGQVFISESEKNFSDDKAKRIATAKCAFFELQVVKALDGH